MIQDINNIDFDKSILKSTKPVVVAVYTQSCPHCRQLDPLFESTSKSNHLSFEFFKLDAQANMEITKRYKVFTVPTLLFFVHGKLVNKKRGVINQKRIEKRLFPLLDYDAEKAEKNEITSLFKLPWQ